MANSNAPTNASLSFVANNPGTKDVSYIIPLWVMKLSQSHSLSGSSHQSKHAKFFYPRAYAPGNMSVSGRLRDEREWQSLAFFIRNHQRELANIPFDQRFSRINGKNDGYKRLMKLSVPSEGIALRGWIDTFKIAKKGYKNVAPEYSFDFFVVFDNTATNIGISSRVQKYYDLGLGQALKKRSITDSRPSNRDDQAWDKRTEQDSRPSNRDDQAWDRSGTDVGPRNRADQPSGFIGDR